MLLLLVVLLLFIHETVIQTFQILKDKTVFVSYVVVSLYNASWLVIQISINSWYVCYLFIIWRAQYVLFYNAVCLESITYSFNNLWIRFFLDEVESLSVPALIVQTKNTWNVNEPKWSRVTLCGMIRKIKMVLFIWSTL